MIKDFGVTITIERYATGSWSNGRFIKGVKTEFNIVASVQILRGNETLLLPEARRTKENIKIYSEEKLRTTDEKNMTSVDIVVYNNKKYEVHKVDNWVSNDTDIPHYKSIASKIDGEGGE
jgi:hypothetical protein